MRLGRERQGNLVRTNKCALISKQSSVSQDLFRDFTHDDTYTKYISEFTIEQDHYHAI